MPNWLPIALRSEFKGAETSCRAESALADFERCKPEVLVLAFSDQGNAVSHYAALSQTSEFVRQHPHRTLVRCRTEDVPKAYQLCKSGRFDDYMQ